MAMNFIKNAVYMEIFNDLDSRESLILTVANLADVEKFSRNLTMQMKKYFEE